MPISCDDRCVLGLGALRRALGCSWPGVSACHAAVGMVHLRCVGNILTPWPRVHLLNLLNEHMVQCADEQDCIIDLLH
jgi:hypothetical protein